MDYDPQLLQSIVWDSVTKLDLADDVLTFAQGALERLSAIAQDHGDAVAAINNDPTLSDVGKQARIATVNDAAQRQVAQHSGGVLAKTSGMIRDLQKLMTPTPLPKDSASMTALLIERRQVIRDLSIDPLNVGVILMDAARDRDDVTMQAILTAPSYDTRFQLDPSAVEQAKFVRGQMESPDAAAKLGDLVQLDQMLRSVVGSVEQAVGVPDAIAIAAYGQPLQDQGGPRGNGAARAAA